MLAGDQSILAEPTRQGSADGQDPTDETTMEGVYPRKDVLIP